MSVPDARSLPVDAISADRLAKRGLRMELVDTSDDAAFDAWLKADMAGFHDDNHGPETLAQMREGLAYRRSTAVVDPTLPRPHEPVGTVSSWVADLTVSPGRTIDAWAISSVTVRPTHTGRGVARALLESELRLAKGAGLPLATLTVSEATLYGRYGFGPAAFEATWTVRTNRAKWIGPVPGGVVDMIDGAAWRAGIDVLYDRVRVTQPGHIDAWALRFDEFAGIAGNMADVAKRLRAAAYLDEDGTVRGSMIYHVSGGDDDYAEHHLTIDKLITETEDAYAALWRFALQMPLVHEVTAKRRSPDESVRWQIDDIRAIRTTTTDTLWLRILDVPRALEARGYEVPGSVTLRVSDPLGYTDGTWRVDVDEHGRASVTAADGEKADVLELDVAALSSVYLGGVSLATLARAGRVTGPASAVQTADALFSSSVTPWLPFWF